MFRKIFLILCGSLFILEAVYSQKPADNVLSLFVDEYDHQWFGTEKGLIRKCGDSWIAYNIKSGYPGSVNCIKKQNSNNSEIWLATNRGIVKLTYTANSVINSSEYSSSLTSFRSDTINYVTFDERNYGYFATPKGIGIFANSLWRFYTRLTGILWNKFTSVQARGDTIYFGTAGEGIARIIKNADGYSGASAYATPWSDLTGDTITCEFIDENGFQWFGTTKGISCHTGIESREGWDISLTSELPDHHVTAISGDNAGNIWVGTKNGLLRFNPVSKQISVFTISNGMPSNVINDIFVCKDSSIWIGTDEGASHYDGIKFTNFRISRHAINYLDFPGQ